MNFKIKFEGHLSTNFYTVKQMSHWEEVEWEFPGGTTLPSSDIFTDDDYEFIPEAKWPEIDLHSVTDARVWAREFIRISGANPGITRCEGKMLGWFANAIMAGYDLSNRQRKEANV
mgnify:CR=1 FL=1